MVIGTSLALPTCDIQQAIKDYVINLEESNEDTKVWDLTTKGTFTIVTAYQYIAGKELEDIDHPVRTILMVFGI